MSGLKLFGMWSGDCDFATLLMMLCFELWPYWLTIVGCLMVALVAENRGRRSDPRQQPMMNVADESPVGIEPDTQLKRIGELG